jgi:hypothetical protein
MKDKMIKATNEVYKDFMEKLKRGDSFKKSLNQTIAEACASVAEEEIRKLKEEITQLKNKH